MSAIWWKNVPLDESNNHEFAFAPASINALVFRHPCRRLAALRRIGSGCVGTRYHRTVDHQLRDHVAAIQKILVEDANGGEPLLSHDLAEDIELSPGSILLEVWNPNGRVAYRSPNMNRVGIPDTIQQPTRHALTRNFGRTALRLQVQQVNDGLRTYTVFVALPIHDFQEMLKQVRGLLWATVAVLLLLSAGGGYWITQRALRPMTTMIEAAEAIQPADLSTRLIVQHTGDELERLAITLNAMLDRIEAAFRRITQFTADASHELRTPVALLRTRTEILLRPPRSSDEYRTALEANLADLEHTSIVIGNLMLLARSDAGAESLHFIHLDLKQLVQETCDLARPLAEAKDLSWLVELPHESIWVHADADALQRLLLILLDNAVKYTPSTGSVAISLNASGEDAVLIVRDNGVGIASGDLPHIFERFYRADKARARSTGGAGLGLAIGNWITQQHGGTLTAESTPLAGSIFCVTLPCVHAASLAQSSS